MGNNRIRAILAPGLCGIALVAGAWCAFTAWKVSSVSLGLWGVVLLLVAPASATAVLLVRRDSMPCAAGTPPPLLIDSIEQADLMLKAIRLARASVFVAISFAVVLWFCQGSGMIDALTFVAIYSALCLAATGYLPWLNRREKPLRAHREACRVQLAEYKFARR